MTHFGRSNDSVRTVAPVIVRRPLAARLPDKWER